MKIYHNFQIKNSWTYSILSYHNLLNVTIFHEIILFDINGNLYVDHTQFLMERFKHDIFIQWEKAPNDVISDVIRSF